MPKQRDRTYLRIYGKWTGSRAYSRKVFTTFGQDYAVKQEIRAMKRSGEKRKRSIWHI